MRDDVRQENSGAPCLERVKGLGCLRLLLIGFSMRGRAERAEFRPGKGSENMGARKPVQAEARSSFVGGGESKLDLRRNRPSSCCGASLGPFSFGRSSTTTRAEPHQLLLHHPLRHRPHTALPPKRHQGRSCASSPQLKHVPTTSRHFCTRRDTQCLFSIKYFMQGNLRCNDWSTPRVWCGYAGSRLVQTRPPKWWLL
jgi:hypothetical protein